MAASRPDRITVHHERWTGAELMRIEFTDHNPVDRFMALGVAFHEGALFKWLNQAVGVTAMLVLILALCLFLPMVGVTLMAALVIDFLISAGRSFRGAPV